jgi:Glycosyl transferase family 2
MDRWDLEQARTAFIARDAAALESILQTAFSVDSEYPRIPEWVRYLLGQGMAPTADEAEDQQLAHSLARTAAYLKSPRPKTPAPRGLSGANLEFIADKPGSPGWSLMFFLNHLALSQIKPRRRTAVVGTLRNDGIYILEWIAHYKALGFEHLFLYTNDNSDGSDALLSLLAEQGIITLIENQLGEKADPEPKAFGHAIHLLQETRDFEWLLFIDSDEYLVPAPLYKNNINHVISALEKAYPDGKTAAICYDWRWYVSDMALTRTPGLLSERFEHARPHWLTKTMARLPDLMSMRCQHHPEVRPGYRVVDSTLQPIDMTQIWQRKTPVYEGGQMNHYWPKSFEEFVVKKARGASLTLQTNIFDRPYDKFFLWNERHTPNNYYPPDPNLIAAVHREIAALRGLPGVAALADNIDRNFSQFVAKITDTRQLSDLYSEHVCEPGPL